MGDLEGHEATSTSSATWLGVLATRTPPASSASAFAAAVPFDPVTIAPRGPSVARRRLEPGDVRDHRLPHVLRDVGGRPLLVVATDLPGHDHQVGLGVGFEHLERLDEPDAVHGSPPMPTQVDWPMPRWVSSCTI